MRTKHIATVSAVLLGLSGAAFAQQQVPADQAQDPILQHGQTEQLPEAATGQDPLLQQGQAGQLPESQTGTAPGGDLANDPTAPADIVPETGVAGEGTTGDVMPGTGMAEDEFDRPMRSYGTLTEPYTGTVLGGLSADEVIGMSVVDVNGESVGTVSDLVIGADNTIELAIVDVGGFLGFGAKTTAIELDRVTVAEGDGEIVLDMTREQVDALPDYERRDEGWFSRDRI